MKFTTKITAFLIMAALFPQLILIFFFYHFTTDDIIQKEKQSAHEQLKKFNSFQETFNEEAYLKLSQIAEIITTNHYLESSIQTSSIQFMPDFSPYGFDFFEIINSENEVIYSASRLGLLGEKLNLPSENPNKPLERIEYAIDGAHATLCYINGSEGGFRLYAGKYLKNEFSSRVSELLGNNAFFEIETDISSNFFSMENNVLYEHNSLLQVAVLGSRQVEYVGTLSFKIHPNFVHLREILFISILISLASTLLAIFLGGLITGSARKEIDNLIDASQRISRGNFEEPVIAYNEGEFSMLAESMTKMMNDIKKTQKELVAAEKIAAWQAVGKKLAHEIKNPLTPVLISIDDLYLSYRDNLPDFGKTIKATTGTIKSEINRMTKLLDRFANFARMPLPEIKKIRTKNLIEEISNMYAPEIKGKRLILSVIDNLPDEINIDLDKIKQVLINLIKNGIESTDNPTIELSFSSDTKDFLITVEDNGPGFTTERLNNPFEPYTSSKTDGSGLGLVICFRIINEHGGSMELYNLKEKGAGVTIRLPQ